MASNYDVICKKCIYQEDKDEKVETVPGKCIVFGLMSDNKCEKFCEKI